MSTSRLHTVAAVKIQLEEAIHKRSGVYIYGSVRFVVPQSRRPMLTSGRRLRYHRDQVRCLFSCLEASADALPSHTIRTSKDVLCPEFGAAWRTAFDKRLGQSATLENSDTWAANIEVG